MTGDPAARAAGEALLHDLFLELGPDSGVTEGRMFNGHGLRTSAGFFAFENRLGRLVVKVPVDEVHELVVTGAGEPVTMGTRTMREWVCIAGVADAAAWRRALERGLTYARAQSAAKT